MKKPLWYIEFKATPFHQYRIGGYAWTLDGALAKEGEVKAAFKPYRIRIRAL